VGILGILVVVLVGVFAWMTLRDNARPVDIEDAKNRISTTVDLEAKGEQGEGEQGPTPSTERVRPAPGIYRFTGEGTESLSTPPLSQSQGPEMPATVEHDGDDCWTFRIDYSTNHWQQWRYCWSGDDLVETGGTTWQRWVIGPTSIANTGVFECTDETVVIPAERGDGASWTGTCVGTNDAAEGEMTSTGPYRFAGETTLAVGDTNLDVLHFVRERTMSGAQTGTERTDVWFDAETGLPVRNERNLEAETDTVIGASTYTEQGWFQLAELGTL